MSWLPRMPRRSLQSGVEENGDAHAIPAANLNAPAISRRRLILSSVASFGLGGIATAVTIRALDSLKSPFERYWDVINQVTPADGVKTSFAFGDSIQKLAAAGALDPEKLRSNFKYTIGVPDWVDRLLAAPSVEPIVLSPKTAPYLLNLLWPLGLSTKTKFNTESPINTVRLPSFASTAGWPFGREKNGAVYFNKVESIELTDEQERIAHDVTKRVFRPCCNNSTFFQDCNHGSALLGLIELAASQGATTDELYRIALAANSYWFTDQYARTALYFALFEGQSWNEVHPELILGPSFSSMSGWQRNVNLQLKVADFMSSTGQMNQGVCGV